MRIAGIGTPHQRAMQVGSLPHHHLPYSSALAEDGLHSTNKLLLAPLGVTSACSVPAEAASVPSMHVLPTRLAKAFTSSSLAVADSPERHFSLLAVEYTWERTLIAPAYPELRHCESM